MASFARWCYRHRRIVVIAWLAVLISVIGIERAVGSAYSETFTLPGTESSQAQTLLASALPKQAGDSDTIVWHVRNGSVNDPNVRTRIQALLQKVAAVPSVAAVRSAYGSGGAAQISRDGKTAYATVAFKQQAQSHSRSGRATRDRPGEARRHDRPCRSRSAGRPSSRSARRRPPTAWPSASSPRPSSSCSPSARSWAWCCRCWRP